MRETHICVQIFADHALSHVDMKLQRQADGPLRLYGENLSLFAIDVDGAPLTPDQYKEDDEGLLIAGLPDSCVLSVTARLNPFENAALEGLYASGGMLCTQCEPEGFRRIAFFPDRPDVMSVFTTRIEAPTSYVQLLSNGNLIEAGALEAGRHFAVWHDPHPKPSYLFALVAGDLELVSDHFTTMSGRAVDLHIYVEKGNGHLTGHAMDSLKRSMKWDEDVYGLEYDLDLFQIVAVSHFNMGAMENKGLNIFNSKFVLADTNTATDADLGRVESIIAHEYFHNWTGNRVTCRDWFQLTLKEGLTVFRDQCFTADFHDEGVKRAEDVSLLRAIQFPEDAGPTAHPIRPESYAEINNFYTATVYEKGAEIIRMLHQLLGPEGFRRGMDLYFARHDGHAVTCDDFLNALGDANQRDLSAFQRWYAQAGTPSLSITRTSTPDGLKLTLRQEIAETAAKTGRLPVPIPVPVRFLGEDGQPLAICLDGGVAARDALVNLSEAEASFHITPAAEGDEAAIMALQRSVPSLLRGFSAPVSLHDDLTVQDRLHLAAFDEDMFNRWDSMQQLLLAAILARVAGKADAELERQIAEAYRRIFADAGLRGDFKSLMMKLPSQAVIEAARHPADPPAIMRAKLALQAALAQILSDELKTYLVDPAALEAGEAAARAWQNSLLDWAVCGALDGMSAFALAQSKSQNMTLSEGALQALNRTDCAERQAALDAFEARWQDQPLVMEKYFALCASAPFAATPERLRLLMTHPQFDKSNPNKLRSVVGVFAAANPLQFHKADGSGYQFIAEQLADIDARNPQIAARMALSLSRFAGYDEARQNQMRTVLEGLAKGNLSRDLSEVVSKAVAAD